VVSSRVKDRPLSRVRDVPHGAEETTRLATTVERWWPEIEIKRVGCGFRNQANYERRIMLHSATRLFTSTIFEDERVALCADEVPDGP
jgi:hypothetical protein